MGFVITQKTRHGAPAVEVRDQDGACRLVQSARGATLTELVLRTPEGRLESVIDGYASDEEFDSGDGARSAVLAPFSNRIAGAHYGWNGTTHRLPHDEGKHALHGIAWQLPWTLEHQEADDVHAELCWALSLTENCLPGYPFPLLLELTLTLAENRLDWSLAATNVGQEVAPVGLGWHPYFLPPGGKLDACSVRLPASQTVVTNDELIPLPGEQAFDPAPPMPLQLEGQVVDQCYTVSPAVVGDGVVSELSAPGVDYAVVVRQEHGVVHLFTGDPLTYRPRKSLAIEPNEFMPDAFNREEWRTALALEPGQRREFGATVSLERPLGETATGAPDIAVA
ncbi:aldose 1-epimerase [Larsenimonas rhizosphaerae]|uniref:Aldose 1-epimerase n=1 Tax=Larsenimonas rhizosphaerae TaxID=2944682 RepID=A0AA42CYJ9_9GAMM|nr:aldose 1-epimerase [Larsenimonas rhizosphaerae]MCX2525230.1 aldose 1-epimerase [Larsenimonas rhizosphaerae]